MNFIISYSNINSIIIENQSEYEIII